jgi:hypothetical protein
MLSFAPNGRKFKRVNPIEKAKIRIAPKTFLLWVVCISIASSDNKEEPFGIK